MAQSPCRSAPFLVRRDLHHDHAQGMVRLQVNLNKSSLDTRKLRGEQD